MKYDLIRSRRKTAALHIKNGILEVRAPLKMPKSEIDKFIANNQDWILTRLNQSKAQQATRDNFALDYGSYVRCRGNNCVITARNGSQLGYEPGIFYMPPNLNSYQIKEASIQIYRLLAKHHIPKRTAIIADAMKLSPSAVKINGAQKRWGSCSSKKSLNFSWRLMMADDDAIDYVIIHELAHLIELNHSQRFWAIVEKFLPDYKIRRAKLTELQRQLSTENWD